MALSKSTIPHLYISADVDMSAALTRARDGIGPTAVMVHAIASALRANPTLNGIWTTDGPDYSEVVSIGIAVSTEGGLVAPTLTDIGMSSASEIADRLRGAVSRARSAGLKASDLEPATFTLSNIGKYGVTSGTSIIVPPQLAILCAGAVIDRPVAIHGTVAVRPTMSITISADHRGVDGAAACQFAADFRRLLEAG
ncbi:pyruvate/2-oxoglutarate dehydrogenase complex dihydrolipoamide acyltransferase (E2) component [Mycolicibacterium sp. 624]